MDELAQNIPNRLKYCQNSACVIYKYVIRQLDSMKNTSLEFDDHLDVIFVKHTGSICIKDLNESFKKKKGHLSLKGRNWWALYGRGGGRRKVKRIGSRKLYPPEPPTFLCELGSALPFPPPPGLKSSQGFK